MLDMRPPLLFHSATACNLQWLGPYANKLLQLIAFMNPDRVQELLFLDRLMVGEKDILCWNAADFEGSRYELLAASIVERNIQNKELWIHHVV